MQFNEQIQDFHYWNTKISIRICTVIVDILLIISKLVYRWPKRWIMHVHDFKYMLFQASVHNDSIKSFLNSHSPKGYRRLYKHDLTPVSLSIHAKNKYKEQLYYSAVRSNSQTSSVKCVYKCIHASYWYTACLFVLPIRFVPHPRNCKWFAFFRRHDFWTTSPPPSRAFAITRHSMTTNSIENNCLFRSVKSRLHICSSRRHDQNRCPRHDTSVSSTRMEVGGKGRRQSK